MILACFSVPFFPDMGYKKACYTTFYDILMGRMQNRTIAVRKKCSGNFG